MKKMISHELNKLLIVRQTLPVSTKRNASRSVWGICILILGCKELLYSRRHNNHQFCITPNTRSISFDNYYRRKSCTAIPSSSLLRELFISGISSTICVILNTLDVHQSRSLKPLGVPANSSSLVGARNLHVCRSYQDFVREKTFVRGKGVEMVNQQTSEFFLFDGAIWWGRGTNFFMS